MSVNKVILIGFIGRDPEIRRTQDGRPVATLSIATSERWTDKQTGEKKERTEWHRVVIFNEALVKVAEQYVKKGARLYVEGSLSTRKWTDQAGVDHWKTEVVLRAFGASLVMLDRQEREPAPEEDAYGKQSTAGVPAAAGVAAGRKDDLDDEIPF
jgi:single-strand DNA-binding protein